MQGLRETRSREQDTCRASFHDTVTLSSTQGPSAKYEKKMDPVS
jgi:hypothetical protein